MEFILEFILFIGGVIVVLGLIVLADWLTDRLRAYYWKRVDRRIEERLRQVSGR